MFFRSEDQAEAAGYEIESVGERSASFAADTQQQAIVGLLVAFAGMAVLVFLMFRTFVPSIAAMVVMTVVATGLGIPLLPDIGIVLVFGLSADLMNTYLLNVSLLRYYKYEAINA